MVLGDGATGKQLETVKVESPGWNWHPLAEISELPLSAL